MVTVPSRSPTMIPPARPLRGLNKLTHGQRSLSVCLRYSPKSTERSSPPPIGDAGYFSRHWYLSRKALRSWSLSRSRAFPREHRSGHSEIYRFSGPQRAFEILDEYEGHRFKRKRVRIIQEDGRAMTSWIYLYARSVTRRALIRSGDYAQYRNSF
jgi:gamma-glutamylcyclotransferase (GGCT)/AIG2-like uncharacterized protein YtfP